MPTLSHLPYGLPGNIYRSPMPFSPMFDPDGQVLQAYLDAGVSLVVTLAPMDEIFELTGMDLLAQYQVLGMDVIHVPIVDFSVPNQGDLQIPIQQTLNAAELGKNIAIHCHAGLGRTGIFAACLAKIVFKMNGEEAFRWVRQHIPRAVENALQIQFINNFEFSGK